MAMPLIAYIIYLNSPWKPGNRKLSREEIKVISILAERKIFAEQILQENSPLPKNMTQEIRNLYKDAQLKFNKIIELYCIGADNNSIPIDEINKELPDAEYAYQQLYNKRMAYRNKQKEEMISAEVDKAFTMGQFDASNSIDFGGSIEKIHDIATERENYERSCKRVARYRWDSFPEK